MHDSIGRATSPACTSASAATSSGLKARYRNTHSAAEPPTTHDERHKRKRPHFWSRFWVWSGSTAGDVSPVPCCLSTKPARSVAEVSSVMQLLSRLICGLKGHDQHWDDNFCLRCKRCGQWTHYEV